jgi:hypothetical protein
MRTYIYIIIVLIAICLIWYFFRTPRAIEPSAYKSKTYYTGLYRFELGVNESIVLDNRLFKFVGVKSEGRCPLNVECVSIGEAVVEVETELNGNKEIFEQKIYGGVELPDLVEPDWVADFNIKEFSDSALYFAGLDPYPNLESQDIGSASGEPKAVFFYEDKTNRNLWLEVLSLTDQKLKPKIKREGDIYRMVNIYPLSENRRVWYVEYIFGVHRPDPSSERVKYQVDLDSQSVISL